MAFLHKFRVKKELYTDREYLDGCQGGKSESIYLRPDKECVHDKIVIIIMCFKCCNYKYDFT